MTDEIYDALGQRSVETDVTVHISAGTGIEHRWDEHLQRTVTDEYVWATADTDEQQAHSVIRYYPTFAVPYPEILAHYKEQAIVNAVRRVLGGPDAR